MEDWNRVKVYVKYDWFSVGDEKFQYKFEVGLFLGIVGDLLIYYNIMKFSMKDRNNDVFG